jgi:hypothetical protein
MDEAMVGFKGRSTLKQFIPNKPTKWGYKVWCLSSRNYLLAFKVYEGTGSDNMSVTATEAALQLVHPYHNHNRILYTDRLFTSPKLLTTLLENGTRGCGTVCNNRVGLPREFKKTDREMKTGQMECWQKGDMGALVWKDRRLVYMLTTHMSPKETKKVIRKGQSKKEKVPSVVLDYNQFKGGVDTVDQLRDSYSIGRKSLKWWPRLAWWCIDMCIVNAYSLHCMNNSNQITHLQFRERLMHQLVEKYSQPSSDRGKKRQRSQSSNETQHWPKHVEEQGRCWYCWHVKKVRTQPRCQCDSCNVYLCMDPCFKLYHTTSHD